LATLLISDLHLHAERPAQTGAFIALLEAASERGDALYILGDLFDYWLGDDDDMPPHPEVTAALARFTGAGGSARLMHGNRDFLIAEAFCARTGCELIPDPFETELGGRKALLMHGDLLCTQDRPYQALRARVRDPAWQRAMLARPLAERRRLARELRETSRTETAGKQEAIMDVAQRTVEAYLRRHDSRLLVHGHTHRPGEHRFLLDGEPALRIVLGDWYDGDTVLLWDDAGPRRLTVAQYRAGA